MRVGALSGLRAGTIAASLTNNAAVNINDSVMLTGAAHVNNNTITIESGQILTVNGGTFDNPNPGAINGGGTLTLINGTVFSGVGTITADVNNTSSQVNPGLSPGIINITGDYSQNTFKDVIDFLNECLWDGRDPVRLSALGLASQLAPQLSQYPRYLSAVIYRVYVLLNARDSDERSTAASVYRYLLGFRKE